MGRLCNSPSVSLRALLGTPQQVVGAITIAPQQQTEGIASGLNLLLINITASSLLGAVGFLLNTPPPDGFRWPPR